MEKEQLEKKYYCNIKSLNMAKNMWSQQQQIVDLEKHKNPVYPECVNFFASSKFEIIDFSNPMIVID